MPNFPKPPQNNIEQAQFELASTADILLAIQSPLVEDTAQETVSFNLETRTLELRPQDTATLEMPAIADEAQAEDHKTRRLRTPLGALAALSTVLVAAAGTFAYTAKEHKPTARNGGDAMVLINPPVQPGATPKSAPTEEAIHRAKVAATPKKHLKHAESHTVHKPVSHAAIARQVVIRAAVPAPEAFVPQAVKPVAAPSPSKPETSKPVTKPVKAPVSKQPGGAAYTSKASEPTPNVSTGGATYGSTRTSRPEATGGSSYAGQ